MMIPQYTGIFLVLPPPSRSPPPTHRDGMTARESEAARLCLGFTGCFGPQVLVWVGLVWVRFRVSGFNPVEPFPISSLFPG